MALETMQKLSRTFAVFLSVAVAGCGNVDQHPSASAGRPSTPSPAKAQPASDASEPDFTDRAAETHMRAVRSDELTGIWIGVADNTAVTIRFIGGESRQPDRSIVEGEWFVDVPGHTIGSGLQFIDDEATGVVALEAGHWNTETEARFRSSLGRIERGISGRLYLTIHANESHPGYPAISRIPLTRISDHPKIEQDDVDRMLAAKKEREAA